jgi:hypothetical protein
VAVSPCYAEFVLKNITITLPEEVAHWARKKAAEENTSVARLVGKMLEAQMRQTDDYQDAYRLWQSLEPMDIDAEHRLSREDAHAR